MLRIGQVEATATQDGKYTDGSVAGGIAATRLRAAAFNAMQEELAHIVESAGLALDINDMTQVLKAIQKLTLSRANPFADIKSDGAAAISTALTNLGLASAATMTAATLVVNGGTLTATIPVVVNGVNRALILHAGQVTSASVSAGTITFPSAFPSACIVALTHDFATSASDLSSVRFDVPTRSSANWSGQNTSTGAAQSPITWCWLAIGW